MPRAKFYVRMDTYWQNSKDVWFGPYTTRQAAEDAADCGAGRYDLGQMAADIKNQTRVLGVYNATESRKRGRRNHNTIPAGGTRRSLPAGDCLIILSSPAGRLCVPARRIK